MGVMNDLQWMAAELERRLAIRMDTLEIRLKDRLQLRSSLNQRQPLENTLYALQSIQHRPDLWQHLLDRELISVGRAILLGYYTATGELQYGTPEAVGEVAASLRASGALDQDELGPLLLWCASRCRSDPV